MLPPVGSPEMRFSTVPALKKRAPMPKVASGVGNATANPPN